MYWLNLAPLLVNYICILLHVNNNWKIKQGYFKVAHSDVLQKIIYNKNLKWTCIVIGLIITTIKLWSQCNLINFWYIFFIKNKFVESRIIIYLFFLSVDREVNINNETNFWKIIITVSRLHKIGIKVNCNELKSLYNM